jgi:hypothetical protein
VLSAEGSALAAGEIFEVGGLFSEDAEQGLAPGLVAS